MCLWWFDVEIRELFECKTRRQVELRRAKPCYAVEIRLVWNRYLVIITINLPRMISKLSVWSPKCIIRFEKVTFLVFASPSEDDILETGCFWYFIFPFSTSQAAHSFACLCLHSSISHSSSLHISPKSNQREYCLWQADKQMSKQMNGCGDWHFPHHLEEKPSRHALVSIVPPQ